MVHFSQCSTVAGNWDTETQIEMRDGTVEHFPVVRREGEGERDDGAHAPHRRQQQQRPPRAGNLGALLPDLLLALKGVNIFSIPHAHHFIDRPIRFYPQQSHAGRWIIKCLLAVRGEGVVCCHLHTFE